jgi:hypothetical protein
MLVTLFHITTQLDHNVLIVHRLGTLPNNIKMLFGLPIT